MDEDLDLRRPSLDEQPTSDVVGEDNVEFTPATSNFDYNDTFRIVADGVNTVLRLQDSLLLMRGKMVKKTASGAKTPSSAHFVNFGGAFLFSEMRLEMAGRAIDTVRHPGQAALMRFNGAFNESERRDLAFSPLHPPETWTDNALDWVKTEDGRFTLALPLRLVLGIAEDFPQPFVNTDLTLVLVRARNDNEALIDTSPVEEGATHCVELDYVAWLVTRLHVTPRRALAFTKALGDGKGLPVQFLGHEVVHLAHLNQVKLHSVQLRQLSAVEKPHWVICGFQTARSNDMTKNSADFDNVDLRNVKLTVNNTCMPYKDFNLNYKTNHFAELFRLFKRYAVEYAGKATAESVFSAQGFKQRSPLIIFNVSNLPAPLLQDTVSLKLDFETNTNVPADTSLYVMVLYRRAWRYFPITRELRDGV